MKKNMKNFIIIWVKLGLIALLLDLKIVGIIFDAIGIAGLIILGINLLIRFNILNISIFPDALVYEDRKLINPWFLYVLLLSWVFGKKETD